MTIDNTSSINTSFIGRMTRLMPSLPYVSIPSFNSCKVAFQSLRNSISSSGTPISKGSAVDLTNVTMSTDMPERYPVKENRKWLVVAGAISIAVTVGVWSYFRSAQSQESPLDDGELPYDLAAGNDLEAPMMQMGRKLLSTVSSAVSLSYISKITDYVMGTEGVFLSKTFHNWDVCPPELGRCTVSINSTIPGLTVSQSQIRLLVSDSILNIKAMAAQGNAWYLSTTTAPLKIQVFDTSSVAEQPPTFPQISRNVPVDNVLNSMITIGNQLMGCGVGTILTSFDISNPLFPAFQNQILNTTITGNTIVAGSGNQVGIATNGGFFCVDRNTFTILGFIPNIVCKSVVSSENCYFIGTSTSLISVNATSLTIINSLAVGNVISLVYKDGNCIVGTSARTLVIDVRDPNAMAEIQNNAGVVTQYRAGDYDYTSPATGGFGILSIKNASNPATAVSGLLPAIPGTATFLSIGDYLVIKSSNLFSFITGQDTFTLSGKPKAGAKGNRSTTFIGTSFSGQVYSNPTTLPGIIDPAIIPVTAMPRVIGAVNLPVNAMIPTNAFSHVVPGTTMTYSLLDQSGNAVTNWIRLNPITGQLSGSPQIGDVGSTQYLVQAKDIDGSTATSLITVEVEHGLTLSTIPDSVTAFIDQPFSLAFAATTLDQSSTFTYTFTNLPSAFTYSNGTLSGTVTQQEIGRQVTVTAEDQNGISTTKSFALNIAEPRDPVFVREFSTITILTGESFTYTIPEDTAVSQDYPNAKITYTIKGNPEWMYYDENTSTFTGSPSFTNKLNDDVPITIVVTAHYTLPSGATKTGIKNMNFNLSGASILQRVLQGVGIAGGVITAFGLYYRTRKWRYNKIDLNPSVLGTCNKIRSFCWCCCTPIVRPQDEVLFSEGEKLIHRFKTPPEKVGRLKASHDGVDYAHNGALLPQGMQEMTVGNIHQVSLDFSQLNIKDELPIDIKDKTGRILETVTFKKRPPEAVSLNTNEQVNSPTSQIHITEMVSPQSSTATPLDIERKEKAAKSDIYAVD